MCSCVCGYVRMRSWLVVCGGELVYVCVCVRICVWCVTCCRAFVYAFGRLHGVTVVWLFGCMLALMIGGVFGCVFGCVFV